jgi:hypothetical protein
MPKWIVICKKCHNEFEHSQINGVGMASFYLPIPDIPPAGSKCVCPNCGHSALYQRTDLRYRA